MMSSAPSVHSTDGSCLILASGSVSRRSMFVNVGISCDCHPARVDEHAIKESLRAEGATAADTAEVLAEIKAMQVSQRFPGALVVGADQMLDCQGVWVNKATSRREAHNTLMFLRGRSHHLISCAVVVRDGQRLWHHVDQARLTMRPFSDAFADVYLDRLGARAFETVGVYHLEGLGAQLFSHINGDFFTILGLPLIPFMGFLRAQGMLTE